MRDLTFVVQGKIQPNTRNCLSSIRQFYPGAAIVLSTWRGESLAELDYDIVLENEDPGGVEFANGAWNNTNRQIVSTRNGLKAVMTRFAVKMRTDTQILDNKINTLLNQQLPAELFQNKIIALNLFFRDPRKFPLLFHIGDIFQLGRTEDLLDLWTIPLIQEQEASGRHGSHFNIFNEFKHWPFRYVPEQHIFIAYLAKHKIDASLQYCCQMDWRKASISEALIAKNFKLYTSEELGINIPSRLLIHMRSQDVYEQQTLDNYSPEAVENNFKRMIRRRKRRLIRRFLLSPKDWLDLLMSFRRIGS